MKTYLELATRAFIKHKMPTRLIRQQVHELTDQLQLMLSHIEELKPGHGKVHNAHIKEIRTAMKNAVKIIGKIQQLAATELEELDES